MLLIMILILLDSNNKNKDLIIGILIGIIFMTKQNMGLLLFFVYLFNSKNYVKSVFSFSIPVFVAFYIYY